jgi:ATP-dependent Clp endopeptidase proteolytic subunit ClpP
MSKFKFKALNSDTAEIYLYGIIWEGTASDFAEQLNELSQDFSNINVRINGPGGSIFEGIAIYNLIKQSKCNINIYIDGIAASMSFVIAMAGNKIYMSKYARLMVHRPAGSAEGDAECMVQTADQLNSLEKNLINMISTKTGLPEDQVKSKFMQKGVDRWLTADEALQEKLIDEIYDGPEINVPGNATMKLPDMMKFYNSINIINQTEDSMKKIAQFIALFAIANISLPADASEEMVLQNMQKLVDANKDTLAKLNAAESKLQTFEDKAKVDHENRVKNIVEKAITDGKITAELKDSYTAMATANYDAAEKALNAMKAYNPIHQQVKPGEDGKTDAKANWTFKDYQAKDPKALEAMKANEFDKFKALYKAQYNSEYKG